MTFVVLCLIGGALAGFAYGLARAFMDDWREWRRR